MIREYNELIDCGWEAKAPGEPGGFRLPKDAGLLYEPRVWWEQFSIDSGVSSQALGPRRVKSNPNFWRNGSRHNVVLTHVLMAPVGYVLRELTATAAPAAIETYDNAMGIISKMAVQITAPFRNRFSKRSVLVPGYTGEPAGAPSMRYNPATGAQSSGPFGVSRWMFDKPMWLGRKGTVQYDLSAIPNSALLQNEPSLLTPYEINFEEQFIAGNRFRMYSRHFTGELPLTLNDSVPREAVFPAGPNATPLDAFGGNPTPAPVQSQAMWPPQGKFPTSDWKRQESSRGAPRGWLTAFDVHMNQIAYDERIISDIAALFPLITNIRTAPLDLRVGSRARTSGGGTNEWWWRPGCPVGLTCPTLTSAQVYQLDEPISVAPGDTLELEVQAPGPVTFPQVGELAPIYNIGVSMAGYAEVEG